MLTQVGRVGARQHLRVSRAGKFASSDCSAWQNPPPNSHPHRMLMVSTSTFAFSARHCLRRGGPVGTPKTLIAAQPCAQVSLHPPKAQWMILKQLAAERRMDQARPPLVRAVAHAIALPTYPLFAVPSWQVSAQQTRPDVQCGRLAQVGRRPPTWASRCARCLRLRGPQRPLNQRQLDDGPRRPADPIRSAGCCGPVIGVGVPPTWEVCCTSQVI